MTEVVRGKDADDTETAAAIRDGIADSETTLALIDAGAALAEAKTRMDDHQAGPQC